MKYARVNYLHIEFINWFCVVSCLMSYDYRFCKTF